MNYDELFQMLAAMSDEEFEQFVSTHFNLTPAPGETPSNFRERVIEILR